MRFDRRDDFFGAQNRSGKEIFLAILGVSGAFDAVPHDADPKTIHPANPESFLTRWPEKGVCFRYF